MEDDRSLELLCSRFWQCIGGARGVLMSEGVREAVIGYLTRNPEACRITRDLAEVLTAMLAEAEERGQSS